MIEWYVDGVTQCQDVKYMGRRSKRIETRGVSGQMLFSSRTRHVYNLSASDVVQGARARWLC